MHLGACSVLNDKGNYGDISRSTLDGAEVAVKFIKGASVKKAEWRAKMLEALQEAAALCKMSEKSENVLRFYGVTCLDGQLALVMELMSGSVEEWVKEQFATGRTVAELQRQLVDIAHQIAVGCLAMSRAGVVHSDLKADNVLVQRHGAGEEGTERLVVKVGDLVLAKYMRHDTGVCRPSEALFFWRASPPEVLRSWRFSEATDVYMLGMVMWQMFSGCAALPFEQFDTDVELEGALWAEGGEAVRPAMGAEWDGRVCNLIGRCWQYRADSIHTARPSMEHPAWGASCLGSALHLEHCTHSGSGCDLVRGAAGSLHLQWECTFSAAPAPALLPCMSSRTLGMICHHRHLLPARYRSGANRSA